MADLVGLTELKQFLGDASPTDDLLLEQLLEDVEALFEAATLRPPGTYRQSGLAYAEVLDGTGTSRLYLTYPIAALTSIDLGQDPAAPIESLSVTNGDAIIYGVGSNIITRTDDGVFGTLYQPRYVHVVYDHRGAIPENAQLAIKSVVATAYRRRGSEDSTSESIGGYSHTLLADLATSDPFWQVAVLANTPVVFA